MGLFKGLSRISTDRSPQIQFTQESLDSASLEYFLKCLRFDTRLPIALPPEKSAQFKAYPIGKASRDFQLEGSLQARLSFFGSAFSASPLGGIEEPRTASANVGVRHLRPILDQFSGILETLIWSRGATCSLDVILGLKSIHFLCLFTSEEIFVDSYELTGNAFLESKISDQIDALVEHLPLVISIGNVGKLARVDSFSKTALNTVQPHWEIYRALGVNIPELLVLLLSGTHARIPTILNSELLCVGREASKYCFADFYDSVDIDLDETLIAGGKPMPEMRQLVLDFLALGKSLRLVTRNEGDIEKLLLEAGYRPDLFSGIVAVRPGELKSDHVSGSKLFIDNEFNQREDVLVRSNVPSINLHQKDFLTLRPRDQVQKPTGFRGYF